MAFGYIYLIVNNVNGKTYVGQKKLHSKQWNNDGYMGSGKHLKLAIKKYGECKFDKFLIQYCNNQDELDKQEIFWIAEYRKRGKAEYNIANGGNSHPNTSGWKWYNNGVVNRLCYENPGEGFVLGMIKFGPMSDEVKKKHSIALKGKSKSYPAWNKGKRGIYSEETLRKISEGSKGRMLGRHWYNNGTINVCTYSCPEGFALGMLPLKENNDGSNERN